MSTYVCGSDYAPILENSLRKAISTLNLGDYAQVDRDQNKVALRVLDPSIDIQIEARVLEMAIIDMLQTRRSIGQSVLLALWQVYSNGLFQFTETEHEDFELWARDVLSDYEEGGYVNNLINVVTVVLQDVHQRQVAGKPYVTSLGEPVTVETLIERYGMVSKLTTIVSAFRGADESDKERLLDAAVNKSRTDVEAIRDQVKGKGVSIKIPYRVDYGTEEVRVSMSLSEEQLRLLEVLLGPAGEVIF